MNPDPYHPDMQQSFEEKWTKTIFEAGAFTMIPNLLLSSAHKLGITHTELVILINIESFRWATKLPYPSVQRLAQRTGMSERNVTRKITSLEKKGYIKRWKRSGRTNEYDLRPLMFALDDMADNFVASNRHFDAVEADTIDTTEPTETSAKEDTKKKKSNNNFNNILHTEAVQGEILPKKYQGEFDEV